MCTTYVTEREQNIEFVQRASPIRLPVSVSTNITPSHMPIEDRNTTLSNNWVTSPLQYFLMGQQTFTIFLNMSKITFSYIQ